MVSWQVEDNTLPVAVLVHTAITNPRGIFSGLEKSLDGKHQTFM